MQLSTRIAAVLTVFAFILGISLPSFGQTSVPVAGPSQATIDDLLGDLSLLDGLPAMIRHLQTDLRSFAEAKNRQVNEMAETNAKREKEWLEYVKPLIEAPAK